jgi:lipopolysaccharide biosynthesis regulator YciM
LLSRGDLSRAERHRAQHALALDFLKAGLLDRAEEALRKLEGTAFEGQALLALLAIYERSRDWAQASEIARKLEAAGHGNFSGRQAHYLCEQAAGAAPEQAEKLLREAMKVDPGAARPGIDLAALQRRAGDADAAFQTLAALGQSAPAAVPLVAKHLTEVAIASGRQAQALDLLRAGYEQSPSLVAATKWLAGERLEHEQFHPFVQGALDHAVKPLTRYRCAACGFEAKQHFWQCPGCQAWDSYPARRVEEL